MDCRSRKRGAPGTTRSHIGSLPGWPRSIRATPISSGSSLARRRIAPVRVANASLEPSDATTALEASPSRPLLTVVIPVYNGGDDIVENVRVIQRAVTDALPGEKVELIVVSDGSIDD